MFCLRQGSFQSTRNLTLERLSWICQPVTPGKFLPGFSGNIKVDSLRLRMYSGIGTTGDRHSVMRAKHQLQRIL